MNLEWGKSTSVVVGNGAERRKQQYSLDIFVELDKELNIYSCIKKLEFD